MDFKMQYTIHSFNWLPWFYYIPCDNEYILTCFYPFEFWFLHIPLFLGFFFSFFCLWLEKYTFYPVVSLRVPNHKPHEYLTKGLKLNTTLFLFLTNPESWNTLNLLTPTPPPIHIPFLPSTWGLHFNLSS